MSASIEIHLKAALTARFAVVVAIIVVQNIHLKVIASKIVRVIVDILTVELWMTRFGIKVPVDTHHRCDNHEFRIVEWIGVLHNLIVVVMTMMITIVNIIVVGVTIIVIVIII